jgi:hypothetical protein
MILAACTPAAEQAVVTVIVGGEVQVGNSHPGAEPAVPRCSPWRSAFQATWPRSIRVCPSQHMKRPSLTRCPSA